MTGQVSQFWTMMDDVESLITRSWMSVVFGDIKRGNGCAHKEVAQTQVSIEQLHAPRIDRGSTVGPSQSSWRGSLARISQNEQYTATVQFSCLSSNDAPKTNCVKVTNKKRRNCCFSAHHRITLKHGGFYYFFGR